MSRPPAAGNWPLRPVQQPDARHHGIYTSAAPDVPKSWSAARSTLKDSPNFALTLRGLITERLVVGFGHAVA